MRKKLFIGFAVFHILYILIANLCSAYFNYCEYYDKTANAKLEKSYSYVINNKLCTYYSRYTGANTGFGYFAPNVRSAVSLSCLYNGADDIQPVFSTREASLRYENLIGALIDNVTLKSKPTEEWQRKTFETQYKYNELIFKNVAVNILNANELPSANLFMRLNYIDHVPLKEARKGIPLDEKLHTIQETKLNVAL
jgi:hypothetical protein